MISLPRLYAVADRTFGDPVEIARELFEGGARLVQVRDKNAGAGRLLAEVEAILRLAPQGAHVIVNDRADIARLAGACGVHLGQEDLPPGAARRALEPGRWVGVSTHSLSQALEADELPVDYVAVGPIFPTATKRNADPALGLESLREICSQVRKPVVAIGGITLDSARDVLDCGAASVAAIGALLKQGRVVENSRQWVRRLR